MPCVPGRARRSPRPASPFGTPITRETLAELDANGWELYHVAEDPAENHNLAAEHRDKLIEMIATWYVQAGKYDVLPVDGSAVDRLMTERPQIAEPRDRYIYRPDTQTVRTSSDQVLNRPHSITADAEIPTDGAEGVLLCQGSAVGGWTFYGSTAGCTTCTTMCAEQVPRLVTRSHTRGPP